MIASPLTGYNLRKIMLLVNKSNVNDVTVHDLKQQTYNDVPDGDNWKITIAKEIIEIKHRRLDIGNFKNAELDCLLDHILT